jgi:chromosome segregation ATPase
MRSVITLLAMLLVLSALPAVAQDKASHPDATSTALQELVNEVRQLRLALERSTVVNFRAQVLLQRLQLQNSRIAQATSHLEEIRGRVSHLLSEQTTLAENVRTLQERIAKDQDGVFTKGLEDQLTEEKNRLEQTTRNEAQLRGEEGVAETALQKEQAAWDDLTQQLAALDQSLAALAAPRTP